MSSDAPVPLPVVWTDTARSHLDAIHAYLSHSSPVYAARMFDRLLRREDQLARHPRSGRMVPEFEDPAVREVLEWPYRLISEVTPTVIAVLAVVHGRRGDLRAAMAESPDMPS